MENRGPSQDKNAQDKNEEFQRSLERARQIGAAGEDPAAEQLKGEALGVAAGAREKLAADIARRLQMTATRRQA